MREGANGVSLTAEGRRVPVEQRSAFKPDAEDEDAAPRLDIRARRLPFQRRGVFR